MIEMNNKLSNEAQLMHVTLECEKQVCRDQFWAFKSWMCLGTDFKRVKAATEKACLPYGWNDNTAHRVGLYLKFHFKPMELDICCILQETPVLKTQACATGQAFSWVQLNV